MKDDRAAPRRLPILLTLLVALAVASTAWAAPVLRTPGYRGVTKPVATQPPTAPDPAELGAGTRPDVLVDDARTAHVALGGRQQDDGGRGAPGPPARHGAQAPADSR